MLAATRRNKFFILLVSGFLLAGFGFALQLTQAPGVVVSHKIVPAQYWVFNESGLGDYTPYLNSTGLTKYFDFKFTPLNATAWQINGSVNATVWNYVKNCKTTPTQACVDKISNETGLTPLQLSQINLASFKTVAKTAGVSWSQASFSANTGSFSLIANIPTWKNAEVFGISDGITNTTYLVSASDCLIGDLRTYTSADSPVQADCNVVVNETGHMNITDVNFVLNLSSANQYTFKSNGTITAIRSNLTSINGNTTSFTFNGTTTIINGTRIGTQGAGVQVGKTFYFNKAAATGVANYAFWNFYAANGSIIDTFMREWKVSYSTGPIISLNQSTGTGYIEDGAGNTITLSGVSASYRNIVYPDGGGNLTNIQNNNNGGSLGSGTWNIAETFSITSGLTTALGTIAKVNSNSFNSYTNALNGNWSFNNTLQLSGARGGGGHINGNMIFTCDSTHELLLVRLGDANYKGCFNITSFAYWYAGMNRTYPIKITTDGTTPKNNVIVKLYNAAGSLESQATTGSDGLVNVSSHFTDAVQASVADSNARNITADDVYVGQLFWNSSTNGYVIYTVAAGGDTTKPLVSIQQPTNIWYSSNPPLNFTATDETALSACWYSLNGAANTTIASCANTTISGSTQGSNTIIVYANDTSNNINSSTASYSYDTLNPTITINTPANTTYYQNWVLLNITTADTGVGLNTTECYYSLDNFANNASISCSTPLNITGFTQGSHTINLTVRDLLNHYNNTAGISFTTAVPTITAQSCIATNSSIWTNITTNEWIYNSTINPWNINNATNGTYAVFNKTGLTPLTQYFYNYTLRDDLGNYRTSSQYNCTTLATPDTTNPQAAIQQPQDIWYNTNPPLNYTATDDIAIDSCWYSVDNWLNNFTLTGCANGTITDGVQGTRTIKLAANDTSGNINNTASQQFSFDNVNPLVTINTPLNQTYAINWVILNTTITDATSGLNTTECYYSLNYFVTNSSFDCSYINLTSFANTNHTVFVIAQDLAGNKNVSANISFTTDTSFPSINLTSPANTTYASVPTLNYTVTDTQKIDSCWYNIGNGNNTTLSGCANSTISGTVTGSNILHFFVNDTAGNMNNTSVAFTIASSILAWTQNLTNQTFISGINFVYDVNATSSSGIGNYSLSDNQNFSINSTGAIQNNGTLSYGLYFLNVSVNDTLGNKLTNNITISIKSYENLLPANNQLYQNVDLNSMTYNFSATIADQWNTTQAWIIFSSSSGLNSSTQALSLSAGNFTNGTWSNILKFTGWQDYTWFLRTNNTQGILADSNTRTFRVYSGSTQQPGDGTYMPIQATNTSMVIINDSDDGLLYNITGTLYGTESMTAVLMRAGNRIIDYVFDNLMRLGTIITNDVFYNLSKFDDPWASTPDGVPFYPNVTVIPKAVPVIGITVLAGVGLFYVVQELYFVAALILIVYLLLRLV